MLALSSGSMTPPSMPRTSSTDGSAMEAGIGVGQLVGHGVRCSHGVLGQQRSRRRIKTVSTLKICPTGITVKEWTSRCSRRSATRPATRCTRSSPVPPRRAPPAELADALGLHANTVRLHLERLRRPASSTSTSIHRGTVGRPAAPLLAGAGRARARIRPAGARLARGPARRARREPRVPTPPRPGPPVTPGAPKAARADAGRELPADSWPRSSTASASSLRPTDAATADGCHAHRFPALPVPGAGRGLPRAGLQPAPRICEGRGRSRPRNSGAVLDVVRARPVPRRGRGTLITP